MTPLLPFAAGLIVGAAAVTVIRSDATRKGLSRAGAVLRETGESGLAAMSRSAEVLRRPFSAAHTADGTQTTATAATDEPTESTPPAAPARKRTRPAETAAKPSAAAATQGRPATPRPRRKPAASDTGPLAPSDDAPGDSA